MKSYDMQTPFGRKQWQAVLNRQTGAADPTWVRRDALTRRIFGRPVSARQAVTVILAAIQKQGDRALLKFTRQLDGWRVAKPQDLRYSEHQVENALRQISPALKQALLKAADNIESFHRFQVDPPKSWMQRKGAKLRERRLPLDRVGIYVPSAQAPLVSTVLMNAVPARAAGVKQIVMATPPAADGSLAPALVAAARLAGVTEIYRLGGALAIGALALGTATVPKVDKIVGPGNIFATEAKRQVMGQVGIDSLAGPSEICILADDTAEPEDVMWDLLAQAEHGSGAVALLLTPSKKLLQRILAGLLARRDFSRQQETIFLFKVADLGQAVQLANAYAPEHASLQVRDAEAWAERLTRAGAIFIGHVTAQAMGDYIAGPNHVLPTGGTAAWASPLAIRDFQRHSSLIRYNSDGMLQEGPQAVLIAEAEGLAAHAQSIRQRLK